MIILDDNTEKPDSLTRLPREHLLRAARSIRYMGFASLFGVAFNLFWAALGFREQMGLQGLLFLAAGFVVFLFAIRAIRFPLDFQSDPVYYFQEQNAIFKLGAVALVLQLLAFGSIVFIFFG